MIAIMDIKTINLAATWKKTDVGQWTLQRPDDSATGMAIAYHGGLFIATDGGVQIAKDADLSVVRRAANNHYRNRSHV